MLVVPSCDSNILFVSLHAKGGVCASAFSRHNIFLYFVRARFAQTPSMFFVNIMKEKTL